jgi:hypothetical protein
MLYVTVQMNMRLSEKLISDIDFVAQILGVTRSEWLKVKFAEFVKEQKEILLEELEMKFVREQITETEFKKKAGYAPTKAMMYAQKQIKQAAQNYLSDMTNKALKRKYGY